MSTYRVSLNRASFQEGQRTVTRAHAKRQNEYSINGAKTDCGGGLTDNCSGVGPARVSLPHAVTSFAETTR